LRHRQTKEAETGRQILNRRATSRLYIDGLSRLRIADETISKPGQADASHSYRFSYNMRSELADANATNVSGFNWRRERFAYDKAGNVQTYDVNTSTVPTPPVSTAYSYTNIALNF
jgi:hypothetical protein